jgi:hypothetical protein
MKRSRNPIIPSNLRQRLETTRLEALALFRALDRVNLTPNEIPQTLLRDLFELDADFAEALWALDQPPHSLDFRAMVRDTLGSLKGWSDFCQDFLAELPTSVLKPLAAQQATIRSKLTIQDAYSQVPGRDPNAGTP